MQDGADTEKRGPPPLKKWLWRSYLRAALVPLLLIELTFVALYWGTSRFVYDRSATAITEISTEALRAASRREAEIIARRLQTIAAMTQVYSEEAARALSQPSDGVSPEERARHAYTADGVFYSTEDTGGSAVYYSGIVPVGPVEQEKVWRTARLDPLMKSITESDPLIQQVYLNTHDSLNRIYPWFDVLAIYPPKMDIPSYNFYYEADAVHNPAREVVWTDSYLDPAGSGWMVSAIAPVYGVPEGGGAPGSGDKLEGVVGIDVTLGSIVADVLDIDLEGDGYAILVSRDGTILALPREGEADLGVTALIEHSYSEAILQDTFKPDSFNLYRRPDLLPVAEALQSAPEGQTTVDLGRPMIAAWATIAGPQWKLMVLTSEASILSGATTLREQLAMVSQGMLAILVLFYLVFFLFLWRRSVAMSARVAEPLAEIERNMGQIAAGGSVSPGHRYAVAEVQTVGDHLVTMGDKLQAASRAKANFLSAMSHEFRTPLNAIIGYSDLLTSAPVQPLAPADRRQVQAISAAGWQLLQLVDGVIELSRIEQGEVAHSQGPLDVLPILRQAVADLRPDPGSPPGVVVHLEEPAAPLPKARGDADIIRRIVLHLMSNGVKYNRPDGRVTVRPVVAEGRLCVQVSDTGIGIPEAMQSRLFTPFDRLGQENGSIGGAGIGLAICRRLADLTGAEMAATSRPGEGSTFTLCLPLA